MKVKGQNRVRNTLKIGILEELNPASSLPFKVARRKVYKSQVKIDKELIKIEEKEPEVEEENEVVADQVFAVDFEVLSIPGPVEVGANKYVRYPTRITVVDDKFQIVYNTWILNQNFEKEDTGFELYVHGLPRYFYAKFGVPQEQVKKEFEKLMKKAKIVVGYGHPYLFDLLGLPVPTEKIRDIRKARLGSKSQIAFSKKRFDDLARAHLGHRCTRNTHSTTEYCDAYLKLYNIFKDDPKNWEPITAEV